MRVKELIKQLKSMPQDIEVHFTAHDNNDWETQGSVELITHIVKADFEHEKANLNVEDMTRFNHNPDEWVVLSS